MLPPAPTPLESSSVHRSAPRAGPTGSSHPPPQSPAAADPSKQQSHRQRDSPAEAPLAMLTDSSKGKQGQPRVGGKQEENQSWQSTYLNRSDTSRLVGMIHKRFCCNRVD